MTFLVSDITYLKKYAIKVRKASFTCDKIGKFSALDFYDVLDFFASDCTYLFGYSDKYEF
jgi:hypothetical protein